MRLHKDRLLAVLGMTILVVAFQLIYVFRLVDLYAYLGFEYVVRAPWIVLLVNLMAVAPATWMSLRVQRPSVLVNWILYVMVIGPALVISCVGVPVADGPLLLLDGALLSAFWLLGQFGKLPLLRLSPPAYPAYLYWVGVAVCAAVMLGLVVRTFGFQIRLVSFSEVYDLRDDYREGVMRTGAYVAYAMGWLSNAIAPLLIAVGIRRRHVPALVVGLLIQVMLFSAGGHKSILLSGVFLLLIYVTLQGGGRHFGVRFVWGIVLGVCGGFLLDALLAGAGLNSYMSFTGLVTRRVFIVPGMLTGLYMDFFTTNPTTGLSQSVLAPLSTYPYSMSIPHLIGAEYFSRPDMAANANVWADGFANFGYLGVFLFTVLLGGVLWVADSLARGKDWMLACLVVALPAFALSNSALLTVMMTHGFGAALLLLYLLPPPRPPGKHAPSRSAFATPSLSDASLHHGSGT